MIYKCHYKLFINIVIIQQIFYNYINIRCENVNSSLHDTILKMIGVKEEDINTQDVNPIVEVPKDFLGSPSIDLYGYYIGDNEIMFNTSEVYFADRVVNASICLYLNGLSNNVTVTVTSLNECNGICSVTLYMLPDNKWYCTLASDNMLTSLLYETTTHYSVYLSEYNILNITYSPFIEYYVKQQGDFEEDNAIDYYIYPVTSQQEFGISLKELLGEFIGMSDRDYNDYNDVDSSKIKRDLRGKINGFGKVTSLGLHLIKQIIKKKKDKKKKSTVKPTTTTTTKLSKITNSTFTFDIKSTCAPPVTVTCKATTVASATILPLATTETSKIHDHTTVDTASYIMPYGEKYCRLKRKYITFRDMGLKWVLHPPGLEYGYCEGDCPTGIYSDNQMLYSLLALNYIDGVSLKRCCSIQKMTDVTVHYRVGRNPRTSTLYGISASKCKCV
ncbi:SWPV1-096 [Shearwaterpox virus]|uniref:SWPV1-096 n=1 Tax=Shearwaterpox virus TaxID=1974596 RepID=A0A1V0S7V3_CNPV|nr:SWPV1-096 [Shearwaterpox virus]